MNIAEDMSVFDDRLNYTQIDGYISSLTKVMDIIFRYNLDWMLFESTEVVFLM